MPLEIDDRYVDVDFSREERFVRGDLGIVPMGSPRFYEDSVPLVPRDQWDALDEETEENDTGLEWLISRIYDQGQEGSCASNATCQGGEVIQAIRNGLENVVPLSPISLYKRVGKWGAGGGSTLPDNLEEFTTRGALPLDTPENREKFGDKVMPHTGFRTPLPSNWEPTSKLHRALEWSVIRSYEGLFSALYNRHPVIVGRQGHAILYLRRYRRQNRTGAIYVNSWDDDWGFAAGNHSGGFGFDTESQVRASAQWAFALRY